MCSYFLYLGKTLYWVVLRVFHGDLDFFYLSIVPHYTRDNLELKNISISMKNPSNYPIKCFARIKKITSGTFIIAGALIVNLRVSINIYLFNFLFYEIVSAVLDTPQSRLKGAHSENF